MNYDGLNMGLVKQNNIASVLTHIHCAGEASRKEIAEKIGLTAASLSMITAPMVEEGLLEEIGTDKYPKGAGRKQVLLRLNYDYRYVFSVNIEKKTTYIALTNLSGKAVDYAETETKGPQELLGNVAEIIKHMLDRNSEIRSLVKSISVGVPGIVNRELGTSTKAYGIWEEEVRIKDILQEKTGLKVFVENAVYAFADAEIIFGLGRQYDNLLVLKWGPGVGSAVVIDGRIYEGRNGKAAEVGHLIVDRHGSLCECGRRGCLQTKIKDDVLKDINGEKFDELLDIFADAIVNMITVLAPNRTVLCGSIFHEKDVYTRLVEKTKAIDENYDEKRIVLSALADKERYIGPVASFIVEHL
ncbi:MAG: ROK family transcriptional regulator [Lachnospiraceae bacterium]|nr:ROK family transcriptional regulator [Lachnospiraceae bacterium]